MKKITVLLSLFLAGTAFANAQQLKPNSLVKTNHSTFTTKINEYGRMRVENDKNVLKDRKPKNQRVHLADPGIFGVLNAFTQVFSETRLKELLAEPNMALTYYVSAEGKVLEVSYTLKPNTLITAAELEALEEAIKANVSVKLKWDDTQEKDFIMVAQVIRFSRILDRTQL